MSDVGKDQTLEDIKERLSDALRQFDYSELNVYDFAQLIYNSKTLPPIHGTGKLGYYDPYLFIRKVTDHRSGDDVWIAVESEKTEKIDEDVEITEEQYQGLEAWFRREFQLESRDHDRELLMEKEEKC